MKSYCKKTAAIRGFLHNVSVHLISLKVVCQFMRSLLCSLKIQTCRHDVEVSGARLYSQIVASDEKLARSSGLRDKWTHCAVN